MLRLAEFSTKNSLLVNMASVFIILFGTFCMTQMRREAFPPVDYDIVTVSTVWPGAPTEDVEKFVTIPLEKEIKSVSGVDELNSKSDEGLSEIGVYIDPGVYDKDKVVDDIERAVDRVRDLPQEAEDPEIFELATREFPVLELSVSGGQDERERRKYAEALEEMVLEVDGVSQIRKFGWRDPEFWVEVDPVKLDEFYVSMQEVIDALATQNITLPGGQLTTDVDEFNVRTTGEFQTAEQIENVIIRANDSGNWLRVKHVAKVIDTFEDQTTIAKINGEMATAMVVVKTEQSDAIDVVNDINLVLDDFRESIPKYMTVTVTNDFSYYVKRRLGVLQRNGVIGFFLVLLILFLFLDPVPAFMTALGIPIAIFMTFFVMYSLDISINLVSMLGILLVLGMLVDDGIIVSENVYRLVEEGMPPKEAVIKGTQQVIAPVTATILTTFAFFGPMLFMEDIIGKFIREIPKVVLITLTASLVEAFIILPSHLYDSLEFFKGKIRTKTHEKPWYTAIKNHYTKTLNFCIQHRYFIMVCMFYALIFSFGIMFSIGMKKILYGFGLSLIALTVIVAFLTKRLHARSFGLLAGIAGVFLLGMTFNPQLKMLLFAGEGIEDFFVRVEAPKGTPLERVDELLKPIEAEIDKIPDTELDSYRSYLGGIEVDRGFDPNAKRGSHLGQITVFLTPMQSRDRSPDEIADELKAKIENTPGFEKVTIVLPKEGPPTGADVEVGVKGEDYEKMDELLEPIKDYLSGRLTPAVLYFSIKNSMEFPENTKKEDIRRISLQVFKDLKSTGTLDADNKLAVDHKKKLSFDNPVFNGVDIKKLKKSVTSTIKRIELNALGVSDVGVSYDFGKKQLKVVVNEELAKRHYLNVGDVAKTIRNVFKGGVATSIKPIKAEEEIDVVVRFPEEFRENRDVFENILIPNSRGNLIKLGSVAEVIETEGVYKIDHLDGKRVYYVTARVDKRNVTSNDINLDMQKRFKGLTEDAIGYAMEFGGEFEDQQKSFKNILISYIFALFLCYIILVAMFKSLIQPLVVMSAIPFGIIGVILSFWAHDIVLTNIFNSAIGRPMNFFALMGLVGLSGIAVNDSVVLVDFINRLRREGKERRASLLEAGRMRLRPVIMTSVTTIGGLISVAYGIGGGDPFLKPMALAIVWGLLFSTLLTLIGIPCIYAIIDDFTERVLHRKMVSHGSS